MLRRVATTTQRVGPRSALGAMPAIRARQHMRQFVSVRQLVPSLVNLTRHPLFPGFLAAPVLAGSAAAEENIEAVQTAVSEVIAAVVENPVTVADVAPNHFLTFRLAMYALDALHSTGLSWSGAIITLTCAIRVCLIPLLIMVTKSTAKIALMKPDLEIINAEFNRRKALNVDPAENSAQYSRDMLGVYNKHRVNPLAPMLMPMVSAPIFLSMFMSVNAMCNAKVTGFSTEGLFWFQNLTLPDPYIVLPCLSAWTGVLLLKRGSESGGVIDPKMAPMLKIFGLIGIITPVFTRTFPSGTLLYFSAMSIMSFMQGEVTRSDAFRRALGVPTLSEIRIRSKIPAYQPFQEGSPEPPLTPNKVEPEDKDKKPARKKPLPLPYRKR